MKNYLTFKELASECLHIANVTRRELPSIGLLQTIINDKLMKIYRLTDGINDPFYNFTYPLTTVQADQETLIDVATGGPNALISSINATTKTIVRTLNAFTVGEILCITYANKTGGVINYQCVARITAVFTGGLSATYSVIAGNDYTFNSTTTKLSVIILKSYSTLTADISSLYLKAIKKITDVGGSGGAVRVYKGFIDSEKYSDFVNDPYSESEIGYYHRGDTVEFTVGASATAMDTPVLEYTGKPNLYTDDTVDDAILIPPEDNQLLKDEVVAELCPMFNKPVPADVSARLQYLQGIYQAAAANKQTNLAEKGK